MLHIMSRALNNRYSVSCRISDTESNNEYREVVDKMNVYPDKGSIENVDGKIIVKLSENGE
jgi:hypothetical protein